MILLFMIVFICVGQSYGMQNQLDAIEQDYAILVPYVVRRLELSAADVSPFELFRRFANNNSIINFSVPCNYLSPSEHIAHIIKKQRIRMGRDYNSKKIEMGENQKALNVWFITYFQEDIVPRMKEELKKDCAEKELIEKNSSSGI